MTRNQIHFATSLPSSSEAVDGMEDELPIITNNDSHHCHNRTK